MKLFELVEYLKKHAIVLDVVDGKLTISGDETKLTTTLIEGIKQFKDALSAYTHYKNSDKIAQSGNVEGGPCPLSFAQRRLYFLYQYEPLTTHFNLPVCLSLSENFVEASFKSALLSLVQRHKILCTTYSILDGIPVQNYDENRTVDYKYDDLSEKTAKVVSDTCESIVQNVCLSPFDLQNDLPLKVRLLKLPQQTYSLYMVFHHIATDQWSINIFLDELRILYKNFSSDQQQPLAPLSLSYLDFAQWQNDHDENGCYEVVKSYWKDYFSGVSGFLQLPLDYERPATQQFTNGFTSRAIPKKLSTKVAKFIDKTGVSEYSFYLSVFNILLSKLCNENDIVVGVDVFGRDHHDLNDIQGFFVNQLALRSIIDHQQFFDEYVRQVHKDTLRCFSYQDMPFDLLVESLELERTTAFSPLFQVKYLYDASEQSLEPFEGVTATIENPFEIQSQYDITLKIFNGEVHVYYNKYLFCPSTIESWVDNFIAISEEGGGSTIRLNDTLQQKLTKEVANRVEGKIVTPPETTIIQNIEKSALSWPDDIAITTDSENLTYGQLMQKVNLVAANLIDMGVEKGMTIGIYLNRSADYIIALLAIMKSGAVFMPLDPDNPIEQLDYMLDNSGASIILTNEKFSHYLTNFYGVILEIELLIQIENTIDDLNIPCIEPDDIAYLLYTSGSTGRPKGILVRQRSLSNLCCWYDDFSNLQQSSAALLMIATGFDASIKEILMPLMKGAQLVVAKSDVFDPDYLLDLIELHSVKHVNAVPSAAYALLKQDESNDYLRLKSFEFFAVGGEPMNLSLFKPWLNSDNCHTKLANLYGPTECTDISVAYVNDKQGYLTLDNVPIGQPIDNVQARIVDENLKLCPIGVPGELLISGCGVGIGYKENEQETAKRFIDSDFSNSKVYKTGDFCKYDQSGNIVYIGRQDGQIKIRGKRVEVSQITFHISQLLTNSRSVVQLYREDAIETLVAFVEGKSNLRPGEIKAYLTKQLPLYMVPSTILFVDEFPFSVNGKTSSKALEKIYRQLKNEQSEFITCDFNELEQNIADVWCDILAIKQINPQDNFFSIGGDSILSIQVVSELKKHGLECSVYDVFKYPTFETFSKFLSNAPTLKYSNSEPDFIEPFSLINEDDHLLITDEFEDAYPLTRLQQGMLYDCDLQQSASLYHDIFCFEIQFKYTFKQSYFVQAINEVINDHPSLRTVFDTQRYSKPLQLVRKKSTENIIEHNICDLTPSQQKDFINAKLKQIKTSKLDLLNDSLINFTIIIVSKNSVFFINDSHHAIIDGWSNALLNKQIYDNYKRLRQNVTTSNKVIDLKANFAAYVAKEYSQLNNSNYKEYWQAYLKDSYCGKIAERHPLSSANFHTETFNISEELMRSLAFICNKHNLPGKQVFHAAHFYVLSFIMGNSRLLTGIVDNGRFESTDGEKVVGLFLNTLPIRADLTDISWLDLVTLLDETLIEHKAFRNYPYSEMVNLHPNLKLDSLFNFINFHTLDAIKDENELDLSVYGELFEETSFKFSTTVHGNFDDNFTIELSIGWATSKGYLQVIKSLFLSALQQMTANFEQKVGDFSSYEMNSSTLLTETNTQQLLQIIKIRGSFEPTRFADSVNFMLSTYNIYDLDTIITHYPFDVKEGTQVQEKLIIDELTCYFNSTISAKEPYVVWLKSSDCYYLALNIKLDDQNLLNQFYCKLLDIYHMTVVHEESVDIYYSLLINKKNEEQNNWFSLTDIKTQLIHLNYWKTQLRYLPVEHGLILDYPRIEAKTDQRAIVASQLGCTLAQRLKQVSNDHQLTPFMLLHGALSLVLSRHSNNQDIVIGTTVGDLIETKLEPEIGLFANTLILRADTAHDNLSDYFAHIRTLHLDAQAHLNIHFEQLVEHCNIQRGTQHTPLFQIMLTMNGHEKSELSIRGEDSYLVDKFDLNISGQVTENGISFSWLYDVSLFSHEHIEALSGHLNELLEGVLLSPTAQLSDLPMLSKETIHYLTHELNDMDAAYPEDKCIHELFEQQVKETPDAIAVVFEDSQLTYDELNQRSNQLAHYLIEERKITPDTLVGLCVERSLDMVIGILGILKAGGAYMPIDPNYPKDRIDYMFDNANSNLVLIQSSLLSIVDFCQREIVCIDTKDFDGYSKSNIEKKDICLSSSHLAYVIYTSGSTGRPKGVMVEHMQLNNFIFNGTDFYEIKPLDRVLQFSNISFDIFVEEYFSALCNGCTLILRDDNCLTSASTFYQFCEKYSVTLVSLPTAFWHFLIEEKSNVIPKCLRTIVIGGEVLQHSKLGSWFSQSHSPKLINTYGPTEATVTASGYHISSETLIKNIVPIGKANKNVSFFILSESKCLLPKGVIGELYIGGAGVSRGYLNQPDLTAECFIDNPYYDNSRVNSSKRLYKTGDLVRYLPDENMEFIGRTDEQVKIRGYRIDLGDIVHHLHQCDGVESAFVLAKEIDVIDKKLIAYVKPSSTRGMDFDEHSFFVTIRGQLSQRLPEYMLVSTFIIVEEWPLTPNGKVDKKSLPKSDGKFLQGEYVAAQTKTEEKLVEIWSKLLILDKDKISTTANFFDLGGHSLLIVRLVSEVNRKFYQELAIKVIFEYPTVKRLAEAIDLAQARLEAMNKIKETGSAFELEI